MKALWCITLLLFACSSESVTFLMEVEAPLQESGSFFDFPFPADVRTVDGRPDYTGYPDGGASVMRPVLSTAGQGVGHSTVTTAYFRTLEPLETFDDSDVLTGSNDAIWLVDIEQERLLPVIARNFVGDAYVEDGGLLGVSPMPGIVLRPHSTYAYVVTTDITTSDGKTISQSGLMASLIDGEVSTSKWAQSLQASYEPLIDALTAMEMDLTRVAAATVFTTGDPVADLETLSSALVTVQDISMDAFAVEAARQNPLYCEIRTTVSMPQFQEGKPPYNDRGLFVFKDGLPVVQRMKEVPVTITLPRTEMPDAGYPLLMYFHGSGGYSSSVLAPNGHGPAEVVARHGFASVSAALPLNPERLPGATDYEYLNFGNLAAFRDTFRQGVIESRLLLEAIGQLNIAETVTANCAGMYGAPSLPQGQSTFHVDETKVVAAGQSMGGMYTNLVGAVEPKIGAVVPMAAGADWPLVVTTTNTIEGLSIIVYELILGIRTVNRSRLHPALQVLNDAWQQVEPVNFMPRLAHRPLAGHSARPIFQPVGKDDSFFVADVYNAAAIAYGNQQAGDEHWGSMKDSLALVGKSEKVVLPATNNRKSETTETSYTGVVSQYLGQGYDGHFISLVREDVRYQYGCFFWSFVSTGTATVPATSDIQAPCPTN